MLFRPLILATLAIAAHAQLDTPTELATTPTKVLAPRSTVSAGTTCYCESFGPRREIEQRTTHGIRLIADQPKDTCPNLLGAGSGYYLTSVQPNIGGYDDGLTRTICS